MTAVYQNQGFLSSGMDAADWSQQKQTSGIKDAISMFIISFDSKATRENYMRDIRDLVQFCDQRIGFKVEDIKQITERVLVLWIEHMKKGLSNSTIRRKLNAISSLFSFLQKRGAATVNPVQLLTLPKKCVEAPTNDLSELEMQRVIGVAKSAVETAETVSKRFAAETHQLVLLLLFSTGMRVSEVCGLTVGGVVQGDDCTKLNLQTKGGRSHVLTLHTDIAKILTDYLLKYHSNSTNYTPIFMSTGRDIAITRKTIHSLVKKMAALADIKRNISPHSCRATIATILHNKNVPVGQIQNLLNHKQVTTTMIYIKKSEENKAISQSISFL